MRITALILSLLWAFAASAALIDIQWIDKDDDVVVTGIVDTTADTLTITDFDPGTTPLWTPALPATLEARQFPFATWDIADNFDGTLTNTEGFIYIPSNNSITWDEGTVIEGSGGDFFGLGGGISSGNVFFTGNKLQAWPTSSTMETTQNGPLVNFEMVMLPEPSAFILLMIGIACLRRRR